MKNDLTSFEKNLIRSINALDSKEYTHENFMEWSNSKSAIEDNLVEGEVMHKYNGFYVAFKV